MDDAKLLEAIGRKQVWIEAHKSAYTRLLNVLAGVVGGGIDPSRVLVNLTDEKWEVAPVGERPEIPAQSNGKPVCVTAPAPPPEKAAPAKKK